MNESDHKGFVTAALDVVHSWAMFRLLRRTIRGPRGDVFERTYVSTPGAVGVVALTPDNQIILVSQYRSAFDDFVLEIPAGMRDVVGEDPARTAWRELAEETGFIPGTVDKLGTCLSSVLMVPFSDALTMVDQGEITDAKSVVGILLAARRFHNLGQ